MKKELALFDFDGTITTKDTLIDFIQFAKGKRSFFLGITILSPMLIAYKLKLIKNYKAKEYMLSYFFKDISKEEFNKIAKEYSLNHIQNILREDAIKRIKWHKDRAHKIVIVSASIECWIKPWCDKNSIAVLSTKLDFKNNKFTGKFATKNCYGKEKVNRVKSIYKLEEFEYIYAYGDSKGDKEMLFIANKSFYKPFRKKQ